MVGCSVKATLRNSRFRIRGVPKGVCLHRSSKVAIVCLMLVSSSNRGLASEPGVNDI
jgi:hypothetical protein